MTKNVEFFMMCGSNEEPMSELSEKNLPLTLVVSGEGKVHFAGNSIMLDVEETVKELLI